MKRAYIKMRDWLLVSGQNKSSSKVPNTIQIFNVKNIFKESFGRQNLLLKNVD